MKYRLKQNNKQKTCIIVKKDIDFDRVNVPSSISIGTLTSIAKLVDAITFASYMLHLGTYFSRYSYFVKPLTSQNQR